MMERKRSKKSFRGSLRVVPLAVLAVSLIFVFAVKAGAATAGRVDIRGLVSLGREEFMSMLGIAPGQEVNEEIVRDGIKRAFLKGVFDDIIVRVADGESPTVEVTVKEREFIDKVSVRGDSALSGRLIRSLFLMKEGQQMRYDLIGRAEAALKEEIDAYGYPDSTVKVGVEKSGRPYRVNVVLDVDTGRPRIIGKITIVLPPGYRVTLQRSVLGAMKLSPGDADNRVTLAADLKRIKDFLKKQGYYGPVAGPSSFHDGVLEIRVDPGKHLDIRVEGNSAISESDLLKEMPFFETENFNDEAIEEAIDRMIALYHGKGYTFAQIAPVTHAAGEEISSTFFVFEGERVKIRSITFVGAGLPSERLKAVMSLTEGEVFNPDLVDRDKDSLKEFYAALGYLDASVKDIETKIDKASATVDIVVDIEEGRKTEIGSVDIKGSPPPMRETLMALVGIKPGDPYNEVDISDARLRILDWYTNSGFLGVDVVVTRSVENYRADVVFTVTAGEEKFFGKTVIIGNKKTKYEVFRRELLYKEGQPYSFRVLADERQSLYKLGLFTDVEIEPINGEDAEKDILIKVHEGNAGSVEFGVGYGEYEKYRGYVELSYRNLWGMGREGLLRVEGSSLENRYILQYKEPWFFGTRLPFRTFFLYENRKEFDPATKEILYKLRRYALTAGVEKKLSDTTKAQLYYEFSLVRTTDVKPEVVLTKEDTGTLAISGVKPALIYDTRDNPFDPKKGILAGVSVKLASLIFLSEINFVKAEAYGSTFHRLNRRVTLALSVRGGVAYGLGATEQLPLVERFFLGGRSTVRGYAQDTLGPKGSDGTTPQGGNAYLMGNVEFRADVGRGFGLVPFFDMGNVWLKTGEINPMQLKFTTGLGLRYNTPVGPLRVDYGIKLSRETGESRGEIHFSVGQAF
jgi:outer membrane protein insertion porin family